MQVIRFWFKVPQAEKMNELLTLMTAVFAMVNQVGSYKITPERQKQAEQVQSPGKCLQDTRHITALNKDSKLPMAFQSHLDPTKLDEDHNDEGRLIQYIVACSKALKIMQGQPLFKNLMGAHIYHNLHLAAHRHAKILAGRQRAKSQVHLPEK